MCEHFKKIKILTAAKLKSFDENDLIFSFFITTKVSYAVRIGEYLIAMIIIQSNYMFAL